MNFSVKQRINYVLLELGQISFLIKDIFLSLLTFKIVWRDLLFQIYSIGVKSQTVVLVTGGFTGMVLGAQTYFQFHKVKMDTATLAVVSVSLCDELGPVLTALMVAGRVGASIAAEVGTMRVTEQIDALRTLATHPVDYLVVPRLLAARQARTTTLTCRPVTWRAARHSRTRIRAPSVTARTMTGRHFIRILRRIRRPASALGQTRRSLRPCATAWISRALRCAV